MSGSASRNRNWNEAQSTPWAGQQPYISDVFRQAQGLYNQGVPQYYPGATYNPFNDIQQAAMGSTLNRAQGSPQEGALGGFINQTLGQPQFDLTQGGQAANQAASGVGVGQNLLLAGGGGQGVGNITSGIGDSVLSDTAQGAFVGNNPYLDSQFDNASRRVREQFQDTVQPGINATFGSAGRTGSGIHQEVSSDAAGELGDTLGGLAADIYGNAYGTERANQLAAAGQLSSGDLSRQGLAQSAGQALLGGGLSGVNSLGGLYGQVGANQHGAAGLVPTLSGLEYQNIDRAQGVGDQVQGLSDRILQDDINRHNYYANAPRDLLNDYAQIILGNQFTQSSASGSGRGSNYSAGAGGK